MLNIYIKVKVQECKNYYIYNYLLINTHYKKNKPSHQTDKIQFSSVTQLCLTLCDPMNCSRPDLRVHYHSRGPPKAMSVESVMPCNDLILYHPRLLLPSIFPSIRDFSNESAFPIRWPKYWSFSFNIRPSNEHLGLIFFRMDWLDLLAIQGTLRSLLQHHS